MGQWMARAGRELLGDADAAGAAHVDVLVFARVVAPVRTTI